MIRRNSFNGIVIALSLALYPSLALAEDASIARADIDGDGQDETVALRPGANERHLLVVQGQATSRDLPSARVGASAGDAELRPVEMARNRRAAVYRAPLEGGGIAYEAVMLIDRRGAPTVIWAGITGLRGDRGSRWGDRVIVDDLDGDGRSDILVASIAEEVPLCGVEGPELFPRALEPASGRLRPVILNRLRNVQADEVPLEASRTNPGTQSPSPMLQVTSLAIASTNAGDRGTVEGLAAPRAITDGNPSTVWVEGRPGPGAGEFVTARLLPGPYRVQALALTLTPSPPPAGGTAATAPPLGRLRTFTVLLDGADGVHRFLVTVPDDPSGYPGQPVWIQLPEPIRASCLSIVLGEVFGGRRAPSSTAIAELGVFTDLDFEGGPERLLAALREGTADVEVVLRALGGRALPLLNDQWSDLDTSSRRRVVRALVDLEDPAAASILADAALGTDPRAAEAAREGIITLGDEGLDALVEGLASDSEARRARAATMIGAIGTTAATERLVQHALNGPPEADLPQIGRALRQSIRSAGGPARAAVFEGLENANGHASQILLGAIAPVAPEEREQYANAVAELWSQVDTFEDRYRVLSLASGAGPQTALLRLVSEVLTSDEDRYLRAHAAEVLGRMGEGSDTAQAVIRSLVSGASDQWTGVRLVVAHALGRIDPTRSRATLSTLMSDSWPVVRAAALRALARGGIEGGALGPLTSALSDQSHLVQVMAARLLGGLGSSQGLAPLHTLAQNNDQNIEARRAAARAMGQLCSSQAQTALLELLGRGLEDRRTEDQARVAAEAAGALASYPSPEVVQMLSRAAQGGPVGLRLAAIESLGLGNHPGAREVLQGLTEDSMPQLSAAAAAALRDLELEHERRTCPE